MKSKLIAIFSLSACLFIISCKKESGSTTLKVKLTDAPAAYDEVNVDIREVSIKMDSDSSSWISYAASCVKNKLLEYQDGVDTLISQAVLTGTAIKEVRLVLGSDNSIKVGSESFPLLIPSGSESGLKIKMQKTLNGGIDYLTLDFDAALSVHQEASGYKLRPVIKILQ